MSSLRSLLGDHIGFSSEVSSNTLNPTPPSATSVVQHQAGGVVLHSGRGVLHGGAHTGAPSRLHEKSSSSARSFNSFSSNPTSFHAFKVSDVIPRFLHDSNSNSGAFMSVGPAEISAASSSVSSSTSTSRNPDSTSFLSSPPSFIQRGHSQSQNSSSVEQTVPITNLLSNSNTISTISMRGPRGGDGDGVVAVGYRGKKGKPTAFVNVIEKVALCEDLDEMVLRRGESCYSNCGETAPR